MKISPGFIGMDTTGSIFVSPLTGTIFYFYDFTTMKSKTGNGSRLKIASTSGLAVDSKSNIWLISMMGNNTSLLYYVSK